MENVFTTIQYISYKSKKRVIVGKDPLSESIGISASFAGRLIEGINEYTTQAFAWSKKADRDLVFEIKCKGQAGLRQGKYRTYQMISTNGLKSLLATLNINDSEFIQWVNSLKYNKEIGVYSEQELSMDIKEFPYVKERRQIIKSLSSPKSSVEKFTDKIQKDFLDTDTIGQSIVSENKYLWAKIAEMEQKQLKYLIDITEPYNQTPA